MSATEIKQEELQKYPILWKNPSDTVRLIRRDERNLEIIQWLHIGGEGKRGRKGEERDTWCRIPKYASNLTMAFGMLLELEMIEGMQHSTEIIQMRNMLDSFKTDFVNQTKTSLVGA